MSVFDEWTLEEKYEAMLSAFSLKTVSAFLSYFFSIEKLSKEYTDSFEKFIYIFGDASEVYTIRERAFIEHVSQFIVCSDSIKKTKSNHPVECRIIAAYFDSAATPIKDEIAFMKICNKAFDGFNVFLLVEEDAAYFGCDTYLSKNGVDNIISYPIKSNINWDSLVDGITVTINENNF